MFLQNVRFATRLFRKQPLFSAVVVATLFFNDTATTEIYTTCRRGSPYCSTSYPDYQDYRDRSRAFLGMAAFAAMSLSIARGGNTQLANGMLATGDYFNLLGVDAAIGRTLVPADDRLGDAEPVTVLAHSYWRKAFGGDTAVLRRSVRLNGAPFAIVGVAAEGFRGTRLSSDPELWIPMNALPMVATGSWAERDVLGNRQMRWMDGVIGRRAVSVTIEQARADMLAVSQQLQEEDPGARGGRSITTEATRSYTLPTSTAGDIVRFVTLLVLVVAAALLIACSNIANLLLTRASARRREIAVRLALGAGRGRLASQLLTETVLLAVAGGALGLIVANVSLDALSTYALPGFISIESLDLALDGRVLAFTAAISLLTGLLFGLVPAAQATRPDLTDTLKGRSAARRSGRGLLMTRSALLAAQTALALVLLIGAGLFIRSLRNGLAVDVGFEARNLALTSFDLGMQRYTVSQGEQSLVELTERAKGLPGVRDVSLAALPPLSLGGMGTFATIDGYTPRPDEEIRVELNFVGPDYFRTMGIPLLGGRDIRAGDRAGSRRVVVINETMARRYWPGEDPVGETIRIGGPDTQPLEIVGYARDVKHGLTEDPEPFVYFPLMQSRNRALEGDVTLLVSTSGLAGTLLPAIRRELRELDADLAVTELTTVQNRIAEFLMPQRMGTTLLATLGTLTLFLAMMGIFGVVGYAVTEQRREIGIRLALGAAKSHVFRVVMRTAAVPVTIGIVIGLGASLGVARLAASFLYGIHPTDAATFTAVPVIMGVVALIAAYIPARRAAGVDPVETLRSE
jgi:predicted permease